jgi:hypothetical protein
MRQTGEKRRLTAIWVMESLHREQLAVQGIVRLIQHCAHRWHLGVFEHRIPACFFGLKPVANALTVRFAHCRVDAIGKVAQTLTQCHYPQALALSTPVQQGVELGAQPSAHRSRDTDQFVGQLVERMAQAKPQSCPWKQGLHTADDTVKAVSEGTLHLVRWLMVKGHLLELAIGRGERRSALGVTVTQMPDDTAADDGGQINPLGEATAVFLIGQDIRALLDGTMETLELIDS